MPARNEIQNEILRRRATAQDEVRRRYLKSLSRYTGRDVILYASGFISPKSTQIPGVFFAITGDDIQGFMSAMHRLKGESLDLILHSPGGSMEAADQIVQYLRRKYDNIRAIIPQNAMSAATMIACACDTIVMGKHSAIGPIDPQVSFPTQSGMFTAPAQAVLDEFEQAKEEIKKDPKTIPLWVSKIQSYPHGLLKMCQITLELAREKVEEWLSTYMFNKDPDGEAKAKHIAKWLGDANLHKTHARPIGIDQATKEKLKVEKLEADPRLQELVLSVFHATMVTFQVTDCVKLIENQMGTGFYFQVHQAGQASH